MQVSLSPVILLLIAILTVQPFTLPSAHARESRFVIQNTEISVEHGVYLLKADVDYVLSDPVKEALLNGVSLVFFLEIEVLEYYDWWWNWQIANLEQRYRLEYHALSRQYVVENLNTGVQESYSRLNSVLHHLGRIIDLPLIDSTLLDSSKNHIFQLKVSLDVDELPLPLRVRAYIFSDWELGTDWYIQRLP
ncbi:MAG: DUF4390 domain-containing protein [Gammaproteobacteria bacterium]|nr:DUF4390 domain-containing protein [Gammaproteobacteria bacterium]